MYLKWLMLFFAALLLSSEVPSAQSQLFSFSPLRYSKWGIGSCPKVKPMKGLDMTKLYGTWYLLAHYFDFHLLDRHCTALTLSDANPGKDLCRVFVNRTSIEYDDGEIKPSQSYLLLPNETEHSVWIDTFHNNPSKSNILDTDYNEFLNIHECNQFPRDKPFLYEQHNYILSRTAVWPDTPNLHESWQKAFESFESFRIDSSLFDFHDQKNCRRDRD